MIRKKRKILNKKKVIISQPYLKVKGLRKIHRRPKPRKYHVFLVVRITNSLKKKIERKVGIGGSMSDFVRDAIQDFLTKGYDIIEEDGETKSNIISTFLSNKMYNDIRNYAKQRHAPKSVIIRSAIYNAL